MNNKLTEIIYHPIGRNASILLAIFPECKHLSCYVSRVQAFFIASEQDAHIPII